MATNVFAKSIVESSEKWPYKKVYFSVVNHPENNSLNKSISEYKQLLHHNDRFFNFSSDKIINSAKNEPMLEEWLQWYQDLYYY